MATFMTNIPRRKIYETMLEYEDAMIDMQIMLYNEENFKKYSKNFNQTSLLKLKETYKRVKALFLMFFENKKYEKEENFDEDLQKLIFTDKENSNELFKNKNLPKGFKQTVTTLDSKLTEIQRLSSFKGAKELYNDLDEFNHFVPKLLEIRRDHMK